MRSQTLQVEKEFDGSRFRHDCHQPSTSFVPVLVNTWDSHSQQHLHAYASRACGSGCSGISASLTVYFPCFVGQVSACVEKNQHIYKACQILHDHSSCMACTLRVAWKTGNCHPRLRHHCSVRVHICIALQCSNCIYGRRSYAFNLFVCACIMQIASRKVSKKRRKTA